MNTLKLYSKNPFVRWVIVVCYWAFLTYLLLRSPDGPAANPSVLFEILNNMAHIPALGILTFVLLWAVNAVQKVRYAAVFAVVLLYGISMEYGQSLTPYRTASFLDIGLNTMGSVSAILLFQWMQKISSRR